MSRREPRLSLQSLRVLATLANSGRPEMSGADISRATNLPSGTLYPILWRLEAAQWLAMRQESGDPSWLRRPLRKMYRVTPEGLRSTREALAELVSSS